MAMAMAERRGLVRCALETSLCPHTALGKGGAARLPCTSECQVRGRGRTRPPSVTLAVCTGAGAGVQSNAPGQGTAPMGSWAFADARSASLQSAVARLLPWCPREAAGAPPPRHHVVSNVSRAHAVARGNRSYTARAHVWARLVNAFPVPWLFSRRARDFWPAGWFRRNTTAASEHAHVREA